ncbi:polysaccharide pyruvyl transferase family protein [Limnovirga soli]|uniref:Polysaccharide pyruvyl transferase domain-containing protein n=1 Tax=Limnovirga soli TaxID=2656915 RepID=A0A8J8JVN0_9BACT|nr:polysaccharide pyruvyl transferase family protein [Limnovirga soli]NNV54426.1 hypothetical protein [Limnovirga soli]
MQQSSYLLVGGNFINKGAEAMLKTVRFKILERHPNAQVYCICHPEEREIATRQGFIPITDTTPPTVKKVKNLADKVINKLKTTLGGASKPYADYSPMGDIEKIQNLVAAVDVSGFAYGDKRGYIQPLETIKIIHFCKKNNAKYIFMPQAWGDFKEPKVAANCRSMIKSADAYFTRDDVSRKFVANLLQQKLEDIPLACDIAFHFPIPAISGKEILARNGIQLNPDRLTVSISPNMRIYERMKGTGANNEYVQAFCTIIKELGKRFEILLVPNEIRPGGGDNKDDQFLSKTIYQAVEDKTNCHFFEGYYSAEEIKAIIKETDLLIASRFHSLVFALSLGIPCMAISWSHKYRELFKLFNLQDFVLEDKGSNTDSILQTFEKLYEQRESIAANISETLPKLKESNKHVFNLLD